MWIKYKDKGRVNLDKCTRYFAQAERYAQGKRYNIHFDLVEKVRQTWSFESYEEREQALSMVDEMAKVIDVAKEEFKVLP